jgi:hypothetical protein
MSFERIKRFFLPKLSSCALLHLKHGLRTPYEAFYHRNPKLLGLSRQIRQINFGAFGVFLADLSAPILVLQVP